MSSDVLEASWHNLSRVNIEWLWIYYWRKARITYPSGNSKSENYICEGKINWQSQYMSRLNEINRSVIFVVRSIGHSFIGIIGHFAVFNLFHYIQCDNIIFYYILLRWEQNCNCHFGFLLSVLVHTLECCCPLANCLQGLYSGNIATSI